MCWQMLRLDASNADREYAIVLMIIMIILEALREHISSAKATGYDNPSAKSCPNLGMPIMMIIIIVTPNALAIGVII